MSTHAFDIILYVFIYYKRIHDNDGFCLFLQLRPRTVCAMIGVIRHVIENEKSREGSLKKKKNYYVDSEILIGVIGGTNRGESEREL